MPPSNDLKAYWRCVWQRCGGLDRKAALDLHAEVLAAFDVGAAHPLAVRTQRYFRLTEPRAPDGIRDLLIRVSLDATNLYRGGGRYQVTTFIADDAVGVIMSSVLDTEPGVKHFNTGSCRWRLAAVRQL